MCSNPLFRHSFSLSANSLLLFSTVSMDGHCSLQQSTCTPFVDPTHISQFTYSTFTNHFTHSTWHLILLIPHGISLYSSHTASHSISSTLSFTLLSPRNPLATQTPLSNHAPTLTPYLPSSKFPSPPSTLPSSFRPELPAADRIRSAIRLNGSDCTQTLPGPRSVAKNRPSPPNSAVLTPFTNSIS